MNAFSCTPKLRQTVAAASPQTRPFGPERALSGPEGPCRARRALRAWRGAGARIPVDPSQPLWTAQTTSCDPWWPTLPSFVFSLICAPLSGVRDLCTSSCGQRRWRFSHANNHREISCETSNHRNLGPRPHPPGPKEPFGPERALSGPKGPRVCGEAANTVLCSLGVQLKTFTFLVQAGPKGIFHRGDATSSPRRILVVHICMVRHQSKRVWGACFPPAAVNPRESLARQVADPIVFL